VSGGSAGDVRRFGIFELDLASGELRRGGRLVRLQPQPQKVLAFLVDRAGEVVTRDELKERVWGDGTFVDYERGLNFCILQIRNALGDDAESPRFIQTLPRRGYRFVAPVEPLPAPVAASAPEPPSPVPGPRRWLSTLAAVSALVALGLLLTRGAIPRTTPPGPRTLLAVLPFDNLSVDPDQDYFADGLTEEVITHLGRANPPGLGVIARTSVMRYKGAGQDVARVGRELGVSHVLEGSVRREAGRVRITAQLIRVSDQTHLWAETYDRDVKGALTVQAEVAARVVAALSQALLPGRSMTAAASPEAYDAYLRGRALVNRGGVVDLEQGVGAFEQAVALDPRYAPAWAALADASHLLRMRGGTSREGVAAKAGRAARQAVALDDTLAEGHTALGAVQLWYEWNPAAAGASLRRALSLNPSLAAAHHDLAWVQMAESKRDEAVASIRRAQELDPVSPRANVDVGWVLLRARRYAEALAQCRRTLELAPGFSPAQACMAEAAARTGREAEAVALTRDLMTAGGASAAELSALLAPTPAEGLRRVRAARLQRLEARAGEGASAYAVAVEQAALDRREDAFASLAKALRDRDPMMVVLASDPAFDALRADARFPSLLERIGPL